MPLFNRIASIRIGSSGQEQLLEITDLRIIFRIIKNSDSTVNTAVITIYNLSEDTKNKLMNIFDTIILQVGYQDGDGLKDLFRGSISESYTKRAGTNLLTTIEAGDGLKSIIETKFNNGYAAGTSAWTILDDILKSFGLPEKITNRLRKIAKKKGSKFANAFTTSGSAKMAMNKIIKTLNLEWSIQGGAIKILELEDVDDSPIILLTPDTGLIGLPERINNLKKRKDTKKKTTLNSNIKNVQRKGWRLESLLFPEIEPGGRVNVREEKSGINGEFKVEEIEQRGDNYGKSWNSYLTVSDLNK